VRRSIAVLVLVATLLLTAAACARIEEGDAGPTSGGTLRLGLPTWATVVSYGEYELDPQAVYFFDRWELFRCCLLRTLLSYNGRTTEDGGAELRPDLSAYARISYGRELLGRTQAAVQAMRRLDAPPGGYPPVLWRDHRPKRVPWRAPPYVLSPSDAATTLPANPALRSCPASTRILLMR